MRKLWCLLLVVLFFVGCESVETKRDRLFLLGNEALDNKEYSQAIQYYTNALKLDPEHTLSYNNRGVAHMEDGHPYEALQDYNQAILRKPDYFESIQNRVNVYIAIGRYDAAVQDLDRLIEQYPDSAIFYLDKGVALTYQQKFDKAKSTLQAGKEFAPENLDILINLATLDYYLDDLENAKMKLLNLVSQNREATMAYNTLNYIYLEQEKYDSALIVINQALEIDPSNAIFLNNRGFTYLKLKELDKAIEDINTSILRNPKNMWALRNKALYYIETKEFELAIPLLKKVIDSSSEVEDRYYYLGEAYRRSGQKSKACLTWNSADKTDKIKNMLNQYCN